MCKDKDISTGRLCPMPPILSACLVICHCGDEVDLALRCIQSADLEVSVFLSDNSPDEMTAERLKWSFPGLVVLPQDKNVGLSRAHNAVLPHLQSKYHLIMDPGVSFHPSLLRRMVSYMEAHPNIAVLSPRFLSDDGTEIDLPRRQLTERYLLGTMFSGLGGVFRKWHQAYLFGDRDAEFSVPVESAPVECMLIRTEAFRTLEGFDTRFSRALADTDLCRRVLERRLGSVIYHPDFQVIYRQKESSTVLGCCRHTPGAVCRYFIKWGITL